MTDDEAIQEAMKAQKTPTLPITADTPKEWQSALKAVQLEGLLNTSVGQAVVVMAKDPSFQQSALEIAQKFDRNSWIGAELGWIVLIWLFRAWRLTKANTILTRIWTQAWVGAVFWVGALVLVPWVLWGKSYQSVLGSIIRTLIHQF